MRICNLGIIFLLQHFYSIATIAKCIWGEISGEFSDEFLVDVFDDIHFCYNSFFILLRALRRGLRRDSGEFRLFLLFHERTVFCYMKLLPGLIFCCRGWFFATCKSDHPDG